MKIYYDIPQGHINPMPNIEAIDDLPNELILKALNKIIDERNNAVSEASRMFFENYVLQTKWQLRHLEKEIDAESGQIQITVADSKVVVSPVGFSESLTETIRTYLP